MTDEAMSPLRRRMIEDMTIRKLAPKTQQGYIRTIKDFAAFLGRSPGTANSQSGDQRTSATDRCCRNPHSA
jgi:integrase/recombinase XerD